MARQQDKRFSGIATDLASAAKSLSHPARVTILLKLASVKGCSCGDFVKELPLAQATISQHLASLIAAGFITRTRQGPMSCYAVNRRAVHRFGELAETFLLEIEKEISRTKCC